MTNQEKLEFLLTARDKTRRVFESVGSRLKSITKIATKGVAAIGAAAAALSVSGSRSFREIQKASSRLQESVSDVQAFSLAVQSIDPSTGIDDIQEGLLTLTERFAEAREGVGEVSDVFKRLGLDANLEGPLNQIESVREVMNNLSSDAERIQLTRILFGDADGDAVLGYLRATNDQIGEINEKIANSGRLFSEQDIQNMDRANRALTALKNELNSFKDRVFSSLAPIIQDAANYLTAFIQTVASSGDIWRQSLFYKLGSYIKEKLLGIITQVVGKLREFWGALKGFFVDAAEEGSVMAQSIVGEIEVAGDVVDVFRKKLFDLNADQRDPIVIEIKQGTAPPLPKAGDGGGLPSVSSGADGVDEGNEGLDEATMKANALTKAFQNVGFASGQMGEALSRNGKRSFEKFKKLQIALSTVAAIQGAIAASTSPSVTVGGPFAVFGAYAAVAGHLLAGVAAIKSVNIGGGGGSGAVSTAAPGNATTTDSNPFQTSNAITPENQQAQRPIDLTIVADTGSIFNVDTLLQIVEGINTIPGVQINPSVVTS